MYVIELTQTEMAALNVLGSEKHPLRLFVTGSDYLWTTASWKHEHSRLLSHTTLGRMYPFFWWFHEFPATGG